MGVYVAFEEGLGLGSYRCPSAQHPEINAQHMVKLTNVADGYDYFEDHEDEGGEEELDGEEMRDDGVAEF